MAKLVPNPQQLLEQLLRLVPHASPADPPSRAIAETDARILDVALEAFTRQGIRATTMSQIARDAGISREWLYKRFRNRDAIVSGILQREAVRLIDGLVVRSFAHDVFDTAVTNAFVYAIEFLRDHELLQRVLADAASELSPTMLDDIEPTLAVVVQATAAYLATLGEMRADQALLVAETIVRLGATIAVAPRGNLDLHDPTVLRPYAETVIGALLGAVRALPAQS